MVGLQLQQSLASLFDVCWSIAGEGSVWRVRGRAFRDEVFRDEILSVGPHFCAL